MMNMNLRTNVSYNNGLGGVMKEIDSLCARINAPKLDDMYMEIIKPLSSEVSYDLYNILLKIPYKEQLNMVTTINIEMEEYLKTNSRENLRLMMEESLTILEAFIQDLDYKRMIRNAKYLDKAEKEDIYKCLVKSMRANNDVERELTPYLYIATCNYIMSRL